MVSPEKAKPSPPAHLHNNHPRQSAGLSGDCSALARPRPSLSGAVQPNKFCSPRVAAVSLPKDSCSLTQPPATLPFSTSSSAQNSPGASSVASIPPPLALRHHPTRPTPTVGGAIIASRSSAGGGTAAAQSLSQSSPMRSLSSASGGLFVSAPGKIILFGEHAVVYGRTAIAGSIDLRTYLSLFTSADGRIYLSLPDMNIERTWMLKELQREIAKIPAELSSLSDDPPSLELVVPIARKLSGACEEQCGVQNLAILAFWYLLIGVLLRKRAVDLEIEQNRRGAPPPVSADGGHDANACGPTDSSTAPPSPSSSNRPHQWAADIGPCSLQDAKSKDLLAVKVTVRFKLPSCVGLGSSGAYCVCIAAALLQTAGLIPPPTVSLDSDDLSWEEPVLDIIRKWSSAAESLIHGRASGLDAAICTYGGIASYTPGKRIENLQNAPDLLKVVLINSRVERNTSRLVQTVKENYRKYPAVVEPIFDTIDALAYEAAKILQRQPILLSAAGENGSMVLENGSRTGAGGGTLTPHADGSELHNNLQPMSLGGRSSSLGGASASYFVAGKRGSNASAVSGLSAGTSRERNELTETFDRLNELCRMNNQLLITLGVGHAKVDQICTLLGRYGIHPKMTGAGGGGCLFAFLKPDTSQTILNMIREELRKDAYEMWQPTLGGPGVLQHQNKPDIFLSGSTSSSTSSTGRGSGSSMAVGAPSGGGLSPSTRSNTPASSQQTTPAIRHKK